MTEVKDTHSWSEEKLRRKIDQEWEMASLARQDNDQTDFERHTSLAHLYEKTLIEVYYS